jgi:hypothetical protein
VGAAGQSPGSAGDAASSLPGASLSLVGLVGWRRCTVASPSSAVVLLGGTRRRRRLGLRLSVASREVGGQNLMGENVGYPPHVGREEMAL